MKIITRDQEEAAPVNPELLATQINRAIAEIEHKGAFVSYIQLTPNECRALLRAGMLKWQVTNFFYNSRAVWVSE